MSRVDQRSQAVRTWETTNWPDKNEGAGRVLVRAAKLGEEAGEVLGAVVKMGEGRRELPDVLDEIGDVVITLHALTAELGVSLEEVSTRRWEIVRHRGEPGTRIGKQCECGHADQAHRTSSSFPTRCRYCDCPEFALPDTRWDAS